MTTKIRRALLGLVCVMVALQLRKLHWRLAWHRLLRGDKRVTISDCNLVSFPTDKKPLIKITQDEVVLDDLDISRPRRRCRECAGTAEHPDGGLCPHCHGGFVKRRVS